MILLDSNILIYAIHESSLKHSASRQFIQENLQQAVIAHQNILETLRVLTHSRFSRPMSLKEAALAMSELEEMMTVISPNEESIAIMMELVTKYHLKSNHIFDAYLVATALSWGIDEVATDNTKDFIGMTEITVINPFSSS